MSDFNALRVLVAVPFHMYPGMVNRTGDYDFNSLVSDVLDELVSLTGQIEFQHDGKTYAPKFATLSPEEVVALANSNRIKPHKIRACEWLDISVEIPQGIKDFSESDFEEDEQLYIESDLVNAYFNKWVVDFFVLINIARPGSIEIFDYYSFLNGTLVFSDAPPTFVYTLQSAIESSHRWSWPEISDLPILDVLKWSEKQGHPLEGFKGSKVSRSLCAFSRVLSKQDSGEPIQLLWSLLGIESLYVDSNSGLLDQVRVKSQLILGEQKEFKKILPEMYDFRSRFVHGDLDIPSLGFLHDADPRFEKYSKNLHKSIDVAVSVHLASLQVIIKNEWSELNFRVVAEGK